LAAIVIIVAWVVVAIAAIVFFISRIPRS